MKRHLGFYSSAQVRELERCATEDFGVTGYALMQRAAEVSFRELARRWSQARRLTVVCGSGNNGGDGYEIARLAKAGGLDASVVQVGAPPASGDGATAHRGWLAQEGVIQPWSRKALEDSDVIVDAVFGIGLKRAASGHAAEAITAINEARRHGAGVLAVDVPSGLDADRGVPLGDAVCADVTVSFVGRKLGLWTGQGPDYAGEVIFDNLALPPEVYDAYPPLADALSPSLLQHLPGPRARSAHKGRHGHVLVIGGDLGMAGAALMAGQAALRAGAGLVTVATQPAHAAMLTAAQPELMCGGVSQPQELDPLLKRATVIALGPGLGTSVWSWSLWAQALKSQVPMVVDADALNLLAQERGRRDGWVLTPHPGEAARLLGVKTAAVQSNRVESVRELRDRFGGVVVLKGAGSLVQGEGLALCAHGNPGMAVGGMGDVLTGVIAAFIAQGLAPEAAARTGVLAHALAGDRAAVRGQRGMLPTDLLAELRGVVNA